MAALTKDILANKLVDAYGLNKREAKEVVQELFNEISSSLIRGENVRLSGFGNFLLRDKTPRPGRNPRTGEEVEVSARRVVTFRPGHKLRGLMENDAQDD